MNQQRKRKLVVTHFWKFYTEEATHLKKFKWTGRFFGIVGWLLLAVTLFESRIDNPHLSTWAMVCIAFFSGIFFSFYFWHKENINQWPIFQEFLNREKIAEAAKEYEKTSNS